MWFYVQFIPDPPNQPARATHLVLPEYPAILVFLLSVAGWKTPNPMGMGRVAKRANTRLNRPVPNPARDQQDPRRAKPTTPWVLRG